jgi:hypothetical protein
MTAAPKPRGPASRDLILVGYAVPQTRKRMTRPLHNRRDEIRANAEAAFTMSKSDDVKAPKPVLSGWPLPDAIKVAVWPRSINLNSGEKASLTDLIVANPEVLDD